MERTIAKLGVMVDEILAGAETCNFEGREMSEKGLLVLLDISYRVIV